MKKFYIIVSALLFVLAVRTVSADVVETKAGARIVGKVTQIDGSTVVIDTEYAGTLKIKQKEVTGITTEKPSNIRLTTGTVLQGTLTAVGDGALIISGPDGSLHSGMDKIVTIWTPGMKDPEIIALQRVWAYEAAVDVAGKSGNSSQLATAFSLRATLEGAQDKLQFYSAYDRQVTDSNKSADQFKAGTDYQNSYSGRKSWYLRDEVGFDRVKLIEFSNVAAAGLGFDFIKKLKHTFTGRIGFAHRFESYKVDPASYAAFYAEMTNPLRAGGPVPPETAARDASRLATKESVNSAGLDLGLSHSLELANFSVVNRLSFVPAFDNFNDYRASHESFLELPLHSPSLKLRMGIANDYNSKPAPGTKRLDTTYFTRLVLNWK
jgi:hypothetical protein